MFRLNYTTQVMGTEGAERVRNQEVTQTLRSPRSDIVAAFLNFSLRIGNEMEVGLDNKVVGKASPLLIDRTDWDHITLMDATRCGFTSMPELGAALERAGYRTGPMNTFLFYRVQFEWLEPPGIEQ